MTYNDCDCKTVSKVSRAIRSKKNKSLNEVRKMGEIVRDNAFQKFDNEKLWIN
jgi:hypothetical protein